MASLAAEHGLEARGLHSCGAQAYCPAACEIFPHQGSNPCPLRWQADSLPQDHQRSPDFTHIIFFKTADSCDYFQKVGAIQPLDEHFGNEVWLVFISSLLLLLLLSRFSHVRLRATP